MGDKTNMLVYIASCSFFLQFKCTLPSGQFISMLLLKSGETQLGKQKQKKEIRSPTGERVADFKFKTYLRTAFVEDIFVTLGHALAQKTQQQLIMII